jgi:hypothetical protein
MASKIDLAKQYMQLQQEQKREESLGMLAEDVTMTNPMTGTISGKAAFQAAMANQPAAGQMQISWSEPEEDGDTVKILGTGSPFGPIKVVLGFDGADLIKSIDIGLA